MKKNFRQLAAAGLTTADSYKPPASKRAEPALRPKLLYISLVVSYFHETEFETYVAGMS